MTEILICGQCNAPIEDAYLKHSTWIQCFDCYCAEQESFYDYYDQNESYADHYCRTSCSCCSGDEHHHWDEEE